MPEHHEHAVVKHRRTDLLQAGAELGGSPPGQRDGHGTAAKDRPGIGVLEPPHRSAEQLDRIQRDAGEADGIDKLSNRGVGGKFEHSVPPGRRLVGHKLNAQIAEATGNFDRIPAERAGQIGASLPLLGARREALGGEVQSGGDRPEQRVIVAFAARVAANAQSQRCLHVGLEALGGRNPECDEFDAHSNVR